MDITAGNFDKGCYSERRDTVVNIREAFMLTLCQKTLLCMIEVLIACTEEKGENTPGSVLKYSIYTVFLLTHRILVTVNSEPNISTRKLKAGICGQCSETKRCVLLLRKLRNIRVLFYCCYNDKLHANFWKAKLYTVLIHTDMFEKLSKCINNLPLSTLLEVSRYSEELPL